ncbi:MAG TPA: hypothetical protein VIK22_13220 [Candidatus Anoxymicrobiaceae bacterium]
MNKRAAMAAVMVLGLSMFVIAGCGSSGDSKQAESYGELKAKAESLMAAADKAGETLQSESEQMSEIQTRAITAAMAGDTSTYTPQEVSGIAEKMAALAPRIDKVKAMYQKLLDPEFKSLGGLSAYASYAGAMIKALDLNRSLSQLGSGFLAQVEPALVKGDTNTVKALVQQNIALVNKIQATQRETAAALKAAQNIKSSQRLSE